VTCRAVLSIGGNQGDALTLLRRVTADAAEDGILEGVSSVYATPPWGGVAQDDFLNAVLVVVHPGSPRDVLEWGFARERAAGRTRDVRWGPRTLDVDVVTAEVDGVAVTSDDESLILPHPRARDRAFVLVPWLEVEPDARLDGLTLAEHLAALPADEVAAVRRLDSPLAPEGWSA
jgi:2-amino-4-hydroxy-6-hydroxymethyldihydropteridine diphosphokinase